MLRPFLSPEDDVNANPDEVLQGSVAAVARQFEVNVSREQSEESRLLRRLVTLLETSNSNSRDIDTAITEILESINSGIPIELQEGDNAPGAN